MTVMPNAKDLPSGDIPFRVTDPSRIPTPRYYDEEFYKLEKERLWPHVWQMACRLEQIPNVGDWVEYKILGQSVLIVRTRDGIKAFHNACRHRGVPLNENHSHGNCEVKGFVCPFHGWRWNMDGENTFVYGRHLFGEDVLDKADLALRKCRTELWGGCVFINFDDNAPSYRESIGPVTGRLEAHGADKMRSEWWYAAVLPANWKIAMEAFMEGFHVMKTHPQLQEATPARYNDRYGRENVESTRGINPNMTVRENIEAQFKSLELLSEGMAGMVHAKEIEIARAMLDVDLPNDPAKAVPIWYGMVQERIYRELSARGEPLPNLNAVCVSHPVSSVEFLFPNYFLLSSFSSMSSYRIRPLTAETCLFELWSLTFFPPGKEPIPPMEPTVLPYDSDKFPPIPRQDYSNIPQQQIGLHSKGFDFMRLAKNVEGLISNYQRVIDGYLSKEDPAKLAKATQMLGGNFDGQVLDLGL